MRSTNVKTYEALCERINDFDGNYLTRVIIKAETREEAERQAEALNEDRAGYHYLGQLTEEEE